MIFLNICHKEVQQRNKPKSTGHKQQQGGKEGKTKNKKKNIISPCRGPLEGFNENSNNNNKGQIIIFNNISKELCVSKRLPSFIDSLEGAAKQAKDFFKISFTLLLFFSSSSLPSLIY